MPATIEPGDKGQFDVFVDGTVVASKDKVGVLQRVVGKKGFPDEGEAVDAVRRALA